MAAAVVSKLNGLVTGRAAWLDAWLYATDEPTVFVKNAIVLAVTARLLGSALLSLYDRGPLALFNEWRKHAMERFFRLAKRVPYVRNMVDKELSKVLTKIEHDVAPPLEGITTYAALPAKGLTEDEITKHLEALDKFSLKAVFEGKVSGAVYHGGEELSRVALKAYAKFTLSNPLHPDVYPGVRKMEAEIVSMVVKMFNGGPEACGATTSGGTESILMACKAMRDWARDVKGITAPEMVIPISAHAAFDKAGHYFGIRVIHAPVQAESRTVDLRAVRRLITRNTIMVRPGRTSRDRAEGTPWVGGSRSRNADYVRTRALTCCAPSHRRPLSRASIFRRLRQIVGSAPSFPHGAVDDIQGLAKLALRYNVGLHVDCCLGGFIVPFAEKAGWVLSPLRSPEHAFVLALR